MTTYRLVDHGYGTFKKIMRGREWVGRVTKKADGPGYYARIGQGAAGHEATAATERDAFESCAAKALGYASAGALKARNVVVRRKVRAARAVQRELGDRLLSELMHGSLARDGSMPLFDKMMETPRGATVALGAVTAAFERDLKKGD